jgi:hypothetical protein
MARPIDRVVAAVVVVVASVAVLTTTALVHSPAPGRDDDALLDFVRLLEAGDDATWLVQYAAERSSGADRRVSYALVDANRPPVRVRSGLGSVTVTTPETSITCTDVDDESSACHDVTGDTTRPPGLVAAAIAQVVLDGAYALEPAPGRDVAGEAARCFRAEHRSGPTLGSLGTRSVHCFAADGVPLRTRVERFGVVDERTATAVSRAVTADDLLELLAPFGDRLADSGAAPTDRTGSGDGR